MAQLLEILQRQREKKSSLLHFPGLSQVYSSQHLKPLARKACSFSFLLPKLDMLYVCPERTELLICPFKEGSQPLFKHVVL